MSDIQIGTELTKEDVARLLTDPSPQARADVAAKIGHKLEQSNLDSTEMTLAQDIVRHMAKDLALQVRLALSVSVKKSKNLPHDVALKLAQDVEQVALPVLEFSSILSDQDLVDIINVQSSEKQEAIARRETVSEAISDALVEKGGEKVVTTLLGNKGAHIAEKSFEKVANKFENSPAVQEKLVKREKLPLAVAERLVSKVSDALKDYLVSHHALPDALVSDILIQSREQATVGLLGKNSGEQDVEKLARQLNESGRLTSSLIIRGLCVGDVKFFEAAIAALANVPMMNAQILIHDAGKMGLKSLYDKTGLPQGMFAIIRVALEVVKSLHEDGSDVDRNHFREKVIERILTQYEDFNQDDLNYLLDKLSDLTEAA